MSPNFHGHHMLHIQIKIILSWQLNVDVYEHRHYTCDRHINIKYILNKFRIYQFAVCVRYRLHMIVNDLKTVLYKNDTVLTKQIRVNRETYLAGTEVVQSHLYKASPNETVVSRPFLFEI